MEVEEVEPFHWYITDRGVKLFFLTFFFFLLSFFLLVFLFVRFIRKHVLSADDDDVPEFNTTRRRLNVIIRHDDHSGGGGGVTVAVEAPPSPAWSGVDVEVIENLPVFTHGLPAAEGLDDDTRMGLGGTDECCICLGIFEDKEIIKVMPECMHVFHSHCIGRWLTARSTCPLCRSSIGCGAYD
ncbi:unnamed protein product [Cuscuta europaea]|uniref:RING-type E3 ubiquitin transferase n=1 Tax=Cuscuta europaea TaxID=41803 RepID=A0A9P1E295_CUSEU|nr:unnamed protein product [Cuscuta europaea]